MTSVIPQDIYRPEVAARELGAALAHLACRVRHHQAHPCERCDAAATGWVVPVARAMLEIEVGTSGGRRLSDLEAERVGRMLEALGTLGREREESPL